MLAGDPAAAVLNKLLSRFADDIGHLHRWPVHLRARWGFRVGCIDRQFERIQWTRRDAQLLL